MEAAPPFATHENEIHISPHAGFRPPKKEGTIWVLFCDANPQGPAKCLKQHRWVSLSMIIC